MGLLGNLLCKNRLMKFAGLLTLLLITRTACTTPLHALELHRGLGGVGDLVFRLAAGTHSTCTMNATHGTLNFWLSGGMGRIPGSRGQAAGRRIIKKSNIALMLDGMI